MNAQLINQDSGKVEFYTPPEIICAARKTLGAIDLDPASSLKANETVKAGKIFTKDDDGLIQTWRGRVWMNHPFNKYKNAQWIAKLVAEFNAGNVTSALCICYCSSSEKWFRPLLYFPQCFLHKRTNYLDYTGKVKKGVTKGSVVTFLGGNIDAFSQHFGCLGTIKVRYEPK